VASIEEAGEKPFSGALHSDSALFIERQLRLASSASPPICVSKDNINEDRDKEDKKLRIRRFFD
jgi:hypothetical protein